MRLLIIVISVLVVGCQSHTWSRQNQFEFNQDCMQAEKSVETCECLLNCLMIEYVDYDTAIKNIQSQAVSDQLSICVEQCK